MMITQVQEKSSRLTIRFPLENKNLVEVLLHGSHAYHELWVEGCHVVRWVTMWWVIQSSCTDSLT